MIKLSIAMGIVEGEILNNFETDIGLIYNFGQLAGPLAVNHLVRSAIADLDYFTDQGRIPATGRVAELKDYLFWVLNNLGIEQ